MAVLTEIYRYLLNSLNYLKVRKIFITNVYVIILFGFYNSLDAKNINEYRLKAVYIYNFTKYITWPKQALKNKSEFIVGVIGKDLYGKELDKVFASKSVFDLPVKIKRFQFNDDISQCHILIVGTSEKYQLQRILEPLNNISILTVSDIKSFAHKKGVIEFRFIQNRLNYNINLSQLKLQKLKVSAKLLRIANEVVE